MDRTRTEQEKNSSVRDGAKGAASRRVFVLSAAVLLIVASCVVWIVHRQASLAAPAKLQVETISKAVDLYAGTAPLSPAPVDERTPAEEPEGKHTRITRSERRDRAKGNLLSDDAPARRRAAFVLGRVGTEDDINTLARLVATENDRRTQVVMIRALRRRETSESIRALDECLRMNDQRVQLAAIRSLAGMKSPDARACLYNALESGSSLGADGKRLIERKLGESSSPEL